MPLALWPLVLGHAALYSPVPRNANDKDLPQFSGGRAPVCPCTCDNGLGGKGGPWEHNKPCGQGGHNESWQKPCNQPCNRGLRGQADGQACLWWSQGCSIGCSVCEVAALGNVPHEPITGNAPHHDKNGFRKRYCNSTFNATLPRKAWTMNVHAVEGSVEDSYRFNPWRAPGHAPVVDACGQAGGRFPNVYVGGDSDYTNTSLSRMGDLGSKVLPKGAPQATWVAGGTAEVMWGMRFNHGGGYQYRICPADRPLTEACFQETPLDFDRSKQALVWINGTRLPIEGVWVDGDATWPRGSTWARNPIPRINTDNIGLSPEAAAACPGPDGLSGPGCTQFPPPCEADRGPEPWSSDWSYQGACSGDWTVGLISDTVLIPDTLPAGDYVLGWRYDCEETAQVWQNCADVRIVATPMADVL